MSRQASIDSGRNAIRLWLMQGELFAREHGFSSKGTSLVGRAAQKQADRADHEPASSTTKRLMQSQRYHGINRQTEMTV